MKRGIAAFATLAAIAFVWAVAAVIASSPNSAGHLDRSFAGDGSRITGFGDETGVGIGEANDVTTDRRQRVVAVGTLGTSFHRPAIARFREDGDFDDTFSGNGMLVTRFGDQGSANAVAIDAHQRIVVAGDANFDESDRSPNRFVIARYTDAGKPDHSFSRDGQRSLDFVDSDDDFADLTGAVVDSSGRIVVSGTVYESRVAPPRIVLARLLPNGQLDQSFGDGGKLIATDLGDASASDLILDRQGQAIVSGERYPGDGSSRGILVRFTTAGELDDSFANGGVKTFGSPGGSVLALTRSGRKVTALTRTGSSQPRDGFTFYVERLGAAGHVDQTFGKAGRATPPAHGGSLKLTDLTEDGRGNLVAVGGTPSSMSPSVQDLLVLRYTKRGRLDDSFSEDGRARVHFSRSRRSDAYPAAVHVDRSERIVVAGRVDRKFAITRLLGR